MTGYLPEGADTALDALLAAYPWVKLHIGDPGAAGTANPAADTTRVQATFAASVNGVAANSAEVAFGACSTTETYTHATGWTAVTAGTPGWSGTVTNGAVTSGTDVAIPAGSLVVTQPLAS